MKLTSGMLMRCSEITINSGDLDRIPESICRQIREVLAASHDDGGPSVMSRHEFRYTGPDGVEHIYERAEGMPRDVGAVFDTISHRTRAFEEPGH